MTYSAIGTRGTPQRGGGPIGGMGPPAAPCWVTGVPRKQPIVYGNAVVAWYPYEPSGCVRPLHLSSVVADDDFFQV